MQRLTVQRRTLDLSVSLKFPGEYSGEVFVITLGFALGSLVFFPKMSAARFVALKRVDAHELGEFEKIRNPPGAFKRLIVAFTFAGNSNALPKFRAQFRNLLKRFSEAIRISRHPAFVPKQQAQLPMKRGQGAIAVCV